MTPLQAWLRLGRISNLPTVWTNTAVGIALAYSGLRAGAPGAEPSDWLAALPAAAALLAVAFSLSYVGGMFLNDAFDAQLDALERPSRPIPSGVISRRSVFIAGFGLLGGGGALQVGVAALMDAHLGWTVLSGIALAGTIVAYNWHHKQNRWSPLLMGLCRILVYAGSSLAVLPSALPHAEGALPSTALHIDPQAIVSASQLNLSPWLAALCVASAALLSHLMGLTYAAKQETLLRLSHSWPLALLAVAPLVGLLQSLNIPWMALFALGLAVWVGLSVRYLLPAPGTGRARSIPGGVVRLIAGISAVDALWLALYAPYGWLWGVGAWLLLVLTRRFQSIIPGT